MLKWRDMLFNEVPRVVVYVYATRTQDVDDMLDSGLIHKAVKHLPQSYSELEKMLAPYTKQGVLLIVDDGLSQLESYLPQVFEEFTSKNNTTIIFVSQATFLDSANFRRLSENSHYVVCLRNKRNATKIRTLAFQAKPCNHNFVLNCYKDATKPKPLVDDEKENHIIRGAFKDGTFCLKSSYPIPCYAKNQVKLVQNSSIQTILNSRLCIPA